MERSRAGYPSATPLAPSLRRMLEDAVGFIRGRTAAEPRVGIILGTGLGGLVREIRIEEAIDYAEIPHFPLSTVESHTGRLIVGTLAGTPVVAMQGRFHSYEGYPMERIVFPVRVMAKGPGLGVTHLLISNAAGGMNPEFRRGDLMAITDHINLLGANPLTGPNDPSLGPRFPDMSEAYDRGLIGLAREAAREAGIALRDGVFVAVQGPNLETRAEYRFLRTIGADAVGMSTVPETIAAVHLGLKVFGMSIITDECVPETLRPVDVEEIIRVAGEAEPRLSAVFSGLTARIGATVAAAAGGSRD